MSQDSHRYRLLIVDDSTANIHFLSSILSKEYVVQVSNDGRAAIELASALQPDLILLDIEMPFMNGFELCVQLKERQDTKHIPIIFISAHTEESEEVLGLHLGAVDFIKRPISEPVVKARIKAHLAQRNTALTAQRWRKFVISGWTVDPQTNQLIKDGQVRHLRGKAMELLYLLAQNGSMVVSKDEIIEKVWKGNSYVAETALKATVWTIRQALFEGDESISYIENLPKKGYRLAVPVAWE